MSARFVDFTLNGLRYRYTPERRETRYAEKLQSADPKVREAAEYLTQLYSTRETVVRLERGRSLVADSVTARQLGRTGSAIGVELQVEIEDEAELAAALAAGREIYAQHTTPELARGIA
jgi:replicative DNA helicase